MEELINTALPLMLGNSCCPFGQNPAGVAQSPGLSQMQSLHRMGGADLQLAGGKLVLDKHDTWTKGNSVGSAELFRVEHALFGEGRCGCLYTWVERELSFGWAQPSGAGGGGRACWLGESQMQKEEVGQIAGAEPAQRAAEPTAPPPPSKSDDDARIADIEAKMEALRTACLISKARPTRRSAPLSTGSCTIWRMMTRT